MKRVLLSSLLICSSVFASISGVTEQKVIKGLKNELQVPSRIDKVSSIVDIYVNTTKNKVGGEIISLMYVIDGEATFDKNKLKQAYDKDFIKMTCNSELNKLFGDDKKNTVNYKIMYKGIESFSLNYNYGDCK